MGALRAFSRNQTRGTGLDSRRYGFSCPEPVIDKFDKLLSSVDRKRRVLSACFRDRHVFSGHVLCLLAAAAVVHHLSSDQESPLIQLKYGPTCLYLLHGH